WVLLRVGRLADWQSIERQTTIKTLGGRPLRHSCHFLKLWVAAFERVPPLFAPRMSASDAKRTSSFFAFTQKLPPGTQPGGRPERHFMISLGCNRKGERCLPIAVERMVGPQYVPVRDTKVPTKTFASRSATRHCASKTISLRYLLLIVT